MKQFSEVIVVTVTTYSGTTTPDKNGLMPVMLQCMAGKMPNRNVLSGTVADRAGFEVGKTYLVQIREQGRDKVFGPTFSFTKMSELKGVEIVDAVKKLGPAEILVVDRPEGFEDAYERKGDAVESNITKRVKEGQFEPTIKRSYSHETAKEIKEGTSTENTSDLTENDLKK